MERSGRDVYDWLTALGVEFRLIIPTPDASVPRFHFTAGRSVHVAVPMLRAALNDSRVEIRFNSRAVSPLEQDDRIIGLAIRDERTGTTEKLHVRAVVLATGGFQGDLDRVRAAWSDKRPISSGFCGRPKST